MRPPQKDAASRRLRPLLDQVLPTDAELAAFCQDHFPQVRALFTPAMPRTARVDLLLQQAPDAREVEVRLRAFAPNAAAWGAQRASWPYVLLGLALFTALVGGFLSWRMTMAKRPQSRLLKLESVTGGQLAAGRAAALLVLPDGSPWYGARHKEAPCRPSAPACLLVRARCLS